MNRKLLIGLILLLVIIIGVSVYFMTRPTVSTPSNTKTPTSQSSSDQPSTATMTIVYTNNGFSPVEVTVKKDSTIHISNQSNSPLQFSSADHPTHLKNGELNMGTLQSGEEGEIKVTTVGTWGYHNHLRSSDIGTLIVTE